MLIERLRKRRQEIESTTLTRILAVSDSAGSIDPEYLDGLRTAVSVALDYGIDALERDSEHPAPVPMPLLAQARLAARSGVTLDKVLRRYFLGYVVLGDFVAAELEASGLPRNTSIKRCLRVEAVILDNILGAVTEEYWKETQTRAASSERRRMELVRRLLSGELLDAPDLGYNFGLCHQAAIFKGAQASDIARTLAQELDRSHLSIRHDEVTVWTWFGGREALGSDVLAGATSDKRFANVRVIIGEPGRGLAGWRSSFNQAMAALPIGLRLGRRITCYGDVALLATILQDDLLSGSLRNTYLAPLDQERDGGVSLRSALRAYIETGRNISSAAASLKVGRHTITKRLRTAEERIGRPLNACATELDLALRLEGLKYQGGSDLEGREPGHT